MKRRFLFTTSFYLAFASAFAFGQNLWASACCGGGFSGPSLITGDDRAMLSSSYSQSVIRDDAEASGYWRRRNVAENLETVTIQASHIFWDRWQAGLNIPAVRRSRAGEISSGLGDIAATLGYEILPDWDYHPIRPKGIGFLQLVAPTGKSIQESDSTQQLDARGRGFWALGLGAIFTKTFSRWDAFSSTDLHKSFEKNYASSQGSGRLIPGWGGSFGLGGGFNFGDYRVGSSLTWNYEDAVEVRGEPSSKGAPQRFVTAGLSLSKSLSDEWTFLGQISDQRLFGAPQNTTLGQTFLLQIQKRWLR